MSTTWRPQKGTLEIPEKVISEARTIRGAILNLPEKGTRVRVTLGDWTAVGEVRFNLPEYGIFSIGHEVWIDHHFRGNIDISVDVKVGWTIELLEDGE